MKDETIWLSLMSNQPNKKKEIFFRNTRVHVKGFRTIWETFLLLPSSTVYKICLSELLLHTNLCKLADPPQIERTESYATAELTLTLAFASTSTFASNVYSRICIRIRMSRSERIWFALACACPLECPFALEYTEKKVFMSAFQSTHLSD